jgi:hypothetical protein
VAEPRSRLLLAALLCVPLWTLAGDGPDRPAPGGEPANPPYDRKGITSDTVHFVAYQFAAVAVISLWPEDETNYSDPRDIGFESWLHNVTNPEWDKDRAVVNYVLHPYWGAAYYVRGRERGLSREQAFWYSTLLSSIFEYGAEALVENVSYQDLLTTPVLGSLLGEYVFWPARERILAKQGPLDTSDKAMLILTDPLGALNSQVDRLFGSKSELTLAPLIVDDTWSRRYKGSAGAHLPERFRFGGSARWTLQWRLQW